MGQGDQIVEVGKDERGTGPAGLMALKNNAATEESIYGLSQFKGFSCSYKHMPVVLAKNHYIN